MRATLVCGQMWQRSRGSVFELGHISPIGPTGAKKLAVTVAIRFYRMPSKALSPSVQFSTSTVISLSRTHRVREWLNRSYQEIQPGNKIRKTRKTPSARISAGTAIRLYPFMKCWPQPSGTQSKIFSELLGRAPLEQPVVAVGTSRRKAEQAGCKPRQFRSLQALPEGPRN